MSDKDQLAGGEQREGAIWGRRSKPAEAFAADERGELGTLRVEGRQVRGKFFITRDALGRQIGRVFRPSLVDRFRLGLPKYLPAPSFAATAEGGRVTEGRPAARPVMLPPIHLTPGARTLPPELLRTEERENVRPALAGGSLLQRWDDPPSRRKREQAAFIARVNAELAADRPKGDAPFREPPPPATPLRAPDQDSPDMPTPAEVEAPAVVGWLETQGNPSGPGWQWRSVGGTVKAWDGTKVTVAETAWVSYSAKTEVYLKLVLGDVSSATPTFISDAVPVTDIWKTPPEIVKHLGDVDTDGTIENDFVGTVDLEGLLIPGLFGAFDASRRQVLTHNANKELYWIANCCPESVWYVVCHKRSFANPATCVGTQYAMAMGEVMAFDSPEDADAFAWDECDGEDSIFSKIVGGGPFYSEQDATDWLAAHTTGQITEGCSV